MVRGEQPLTMWNLRTILPLVALASASAACAVPIDSSEALVAQSGALTLGSIGTTTPVLSPDSITLNLAPTEAFAWSDKTSGEFLASDLYSYHPTGKSIGIKTIATGRYQVRFEGLAASGGNVVATAYGTPGASCQVLGWSSFSSDLVASISCFDRTGAPKPSRFAVWYVNASFTTGSPGLAYLWASSATTSHTPSAGYQWSSASGTHTIARTGVGAYRVTLANQATSGGSLVVSAYGGTPASCAVSGWWSSGANLMADVRCTTPAGAPLDSLFTLRFATAASRMTGLRYVWADRPTTGSYVPSPTYQSTTDPAKQARITRGAVGEYVVTFPETAAVGSTVAISAYGVSSVRCQSGGWYAAGASAAVRVRCERASDGAPVDARFTLAYTTKSLSTTRPASSSLPISSSMTVTAEASALASAAGLSARARTDLVGGRLHVYDVVRYDHYLRPGSADASTWTGTLLLADVGRDIVSIHHNGELAAYVYRHGESLSQLLANRAGEVYGVATIGSDGSVVGSLDLDGDGVVDFTDMRRADGTHVAFIQRGIGRAFAESWAMGYNPLCLRAPSAVTGRDLTRFADPRAMLHACPASDGTSGSSSTSGPVAGSPTRSTLDPLSQLCAPYDARMRPDGLTGGVYAGGGSTEEVAGGVLGGLAYRSFIRWLATPTNFSGTITDVAATTATRAAQFNAVAVFLTITLTPATASASSCELGPPGTCAAEARAAREELEEQEEPDAPRAESEDPPPPPPDTEGGTESRPAGPSDEETLARFCKATADGRQDWQRAIDEASENGYAPQCTDPAANTGAHDDNLYCRTMRRLFEREAYDPARELAEAPRCDAEGAVCLSESIEDRIRGKFAEVFHAIGDLEGFTCNPLICDPELFRVASP